MGNERVFKNGTVTRLSQLNNLPAKAILEQIDTLNEQGLEKAEIFRQLSAGKGIPSTHCSGAMDGELTAKFLAKKKPKKHRCR